MEFLKNLLRTRVITCDWDLSPKQLKTMFHSKSYWSFVIGEKDEQTDAECSRREAHGYKSKQVDNKTGKIRLENCSSENCICYRSLQIIFWIDLPVEFRWKILIGNLRVLYRLSEKAHIHTQIMAVNEIMPQTLAKWLLCPGTNQNRRSRSKMNGNRWVTGKWHFSELTVEKYI